MDFFKALFHRKTRQGKEVKRTDAVQFATETYNPSSHALECAQRVRGSNRKPVIFIHGMLRRSGTNFVGELLRLHPDFCAYPNNIYEMPFLRTTGKLVEVQNEFFNGYKRNRERIGNGDFLPVFGAALLAYLHDYAPEHKRLLLKVPGVEYLQHFFSVFPHERLIVLLRDGRDLIQSTIKTWPQRDFSDVCREWDESARIIMAFEESFRTQKNRFMIVKFEDAVANSNHFISSVCSHFGIEQQHYPFKKLKDIPVKGSSALKQDGKMTWKPLEKPSDFNPIGRWSNWDSNKKQIFKKICGKTLIKTGYCQNFDW